MNKDTNQKCFNLLYEPWIPMVNFNNEIEDTGLYDCLVNYDKYKYIKKNFKLPVLRPIIQRLISTIVIDIFRWSAQDINNVLSNEKYFDTEKIKKYFAENEGKFDLFNFEYPFMQVDKNTFENLGSIKPISVATLDPHKVSGHNKVFFNYPNVDTYKNELGLNSVNYGEDIYTDKLKIEDVAELSFVEYAYLLLLTHCYSGQGGRGYFSSLMCNTALPVLYQVDLENENFLTNIIMNIDKNGFNTKFRKFNKPIWRWDTYEYGAELLYGSEDINGINPPFMTGVFFPTMYIRADFDSIDWYKKVIKRVYKAPIKKFTSEKLAEVRNDWLLNKETVVAIKVNDKGKFSGIPFGGKNKALFDMKTYADVYKTIVSIDKDSSTTEQAPEILKSITALNNKYKYLNDSKLSMSGYYIANDKAALTVHGKFQCYLPQCMLTDKTKKNHAEVQIENIQKNSSDLYMMVKDILFTLSPKTQKKNLNVSIADNLYSLYLRFCEDKFKNQYITELTNTSKIEDIEQLDNNFLEEIRKKKFEFIDKTPTPPNTLVKKQVAINKIYKKREKLRKEKESNNYE